MRYDIDVSAALAIVNGVESSLDAIDRADVQVRSSLSAVETSLQSSRVGSAFSSFADAVVMADVRSAVAGGWNAVGGASAAVGAYRSGDGQMAAGTPSPWTTALERVW